MTWGRQDEDTLLVEAYLRHGDDGSFLALYRAHTPALYRMAWRMGGVSEGEVDDVVQEAWLRAARSLGRFRFESSLRTWLTGILVHCLHEGRRRRSAGDALDECNEPEAPRRTPHLRIDLERAIAALPAGMREVFVLHDVEGFTHHEAADVLGVTAGTSKSQLSEARRKLREALTARPRPAPIRKANHD